jgi:hypothetical protein
VNLESELPHRAPAGGPITPDRHGPGSGGGLPSWILLLAIAACALALGAAHLPPIFKKLGLFAVAYGLLVGLLGAWLGQVAPGLRVRLRAATALVFVVALAGQIGIAAESYRIERSDRQRRERADPKQVLARRLLESASEPPDAKSQATLDEFRLSYGGPGTSFGDYLQFRVSNIGIQSKRAAALFWGSELVLGGLAASWCFLRSGRGALAGSRAVAELDDAGGPVKLDE